MSAKSQRSEGKRIARERIERLFQQAAAFFPENPLWSDRCVALARSIAMKHRVRIPRPLKRQFCRRCSAFLVPGRTSRVRVHRGRVVITCLRCRSRRRYRVVH
ncbi:MAG: ribonuclease P [Methanomicrobiales archaeon]|nr:ribonuclease P [Methanomicrobiales archaeon]MDI6875295.1 ribonuclease P [Methanomicrobiales archaeon]